MPWIANIIADASYEKYLFIGGYAGGICLINTDDDRLQLTEMMSGVMIEAPNANIVEMRAATTMLHQLNRMLKANNISVDALHIYTDSRVLIQQHERHANSLSDEVKEIYSLHMSLLERTLSKTPVAPDNVHFHKVRAHVPNHEATPLERLHNLCDRNAKVARHLAQSHFFKPNTNDETPSYGILVNPKSDLEESMKYMTAAYVLAREGLKVRVLSSDRGVEPEDTPFGAGLLMFETHTGKSIDSILTSLHEKREGGMLNGCEGGDRVYARHDCVLHGEESRYLDFNANTWLHSGAATRLMLGTQYIGNFNTTHLTGRIEPASQFVVDAFSSVPAFERPESISQWIRKISEWNQIPVINGIEGLCQKYNIKLVSGEKLESCQKMLNSSLEVLKELTQMLPPQMIGTVWYETMAQQSQNFPLKKNQVLNLLTNADFDPQKAVAALSKKLLKAMVEEHLLTNYPVQHIEPLKDSAPSNVSPVYENQVRIKIG